MKHTIFFIYTMVALFIGAGGVQAETPSFSLSGGWDSKYVLEGVDQLNGDALYSSEFSMTWRSFDAGIWYGMGDTVDYGELNVFGVYNHTIGFIDAYLGYAHFQFDLGEEEDHAYDNEISSGLSLNNLWLTPAIDYVYATEIGGANVALSLVFEQAALKDRLTLEAELVQVFDFGYVSDAYDGNNNTQLGIGCTCRIFEQLSAFIKGSHSWAGTNLRREGLGDVSWISLGVQADI